LEPQECSRWARTLLAEDVFVLPVLTSAGLALHDFLHNWPSMSRLKCLSGRDEDDPVIIPYRELEPFMKPGPLRDELLK
jgi:hypothetical protein